MNGLAALLAAGVLLPQIQVRESPKDWKLLKTGHFEIYYPDETLEPRAREFAGWFEEARERVREVTGIEVSRTINVFLFRSYHDLRQSSWLGQLRATETAQRLLGRRRIFGHRPRRERPRFCRLGRNRALALAEPLHDRILIHCQASDRQNIWFLRHELVHHAQFEAMFPWRLPSWLIAAKDPLVPVWWWEGFADYGAGIFDSRKDEYVRDLTLEGLYSLNELFAFDALNLHDYVAPYYEGSYFFRFLNEKYHPEMARRVFHSYADGFPYPVNRALGRAVGKSIKVVEREFHDALRDWYGPMLEGRADADEFATRLTDSREYYRRSSWGARISPEGERIAYVSDVSVRPEVYVGPLSDLASASGIFGLSRGLDVTGFHSPPCWSPDGKRLVIAGWWKNHDYLFLIDLDGGIESIRLDFDEVYDPCFSPDGEAIAFTALKNGYSDLYVYRGGEVERLTEDRDGDRSPAWSPDGGRIAYVSESGGRPQLHVYDIGTGERRKVGDTFALVDHPRWMPDGKSVVVSADVDGFFDVFRVDLEGSATRLTKVKIGAHYPDVSPDGTKLLFTYAQGRGSDLFLMKMQEEEETAFAQEDRSDEYEQFTPPRPEGERAERSSRIDLEWLMGPVTSLSFLTPGLEFRIGDVVGENSISGGGYFVADDLWAGGVTLVNTGWQPTILASAYGGRIGDMQDIGALAGATLPILPTMEVLAGWTLRERHDVENSPFPEFVDSGPFAGGIWSNLASYQRRDAAWGFAAGGLYSWFDEEFGGDRDLRESFAFVEAAYDLAQDWILWAEVAYFSLHGKSLLDDEELELERVVRGVEERFQGVDMGVASLELRFPIWRDLMLMPFAWASAPETVLIKDLRGFVFVQAGFATEHFEDFTHGDNVAGCAGLGLRFDTFLMLWPLVNARVPLRLEVWWAYVAQDEEGPRGEVGIGISF